MRKTDVTDKAGNGQKVERPEVKKRARRDDMIGKIVCLWKVSLENRRHNTDMTDEEQRLGSRPVSE